MKQTVNLEQTVRLRVTDCQLSLIVKTSTNKCSDQTNSGFLPSVRLTLSRASVDLSAATQEGAEGDASLRRNFFKCAVSQSNSLGVNINFSPLTCETLFPTTYTNHKSQLVFHNCRVIYCAVFSLSGDLSKGL